MHAIVQRPLAAFAGLALTLALAAWLPLNAATTVDPDSAEAEGYRLAGVMDVGQDRLGILQLPQGSQVLIHPGSVLNGGGKVVEILPRRVRIAFPDHHEIELRLSGGAQSALGPSVAASDRNASADDRSATTTHRNGSSPPAPKVSQLAPTPVMRDVSRQSTNVAIAALSDATVSQRNTGSDLAKVIAPVLDLPQNSTLLAINDQAVGSAQQATASLQQALSRGIAVLNLQTPQGLQRVYVQVPPTGGTP
jgi:hypothetical protein